MFDGLTTAEERLGLAAEYLDQAARSVRRHAEMLPGRSEYAPTAEEALVILHAASAAYHATRAVELAASEPTREEAARAMAEMASLVEHP
jgi:hypothetical protein